jgi:hypothetical protein
MTNRTPRQAEGLRRSVGRAVLETTALYGALGWAYVAVVAAIDTASLNDQIIRWLPLRIDLAGILSFALSALSFLVLNTCYPQAFRRDAR